MELGELPRCQTWRAGPYPKHWQKLFPPLSWDAPALPQFTIHELGRRGALLLEGREGGRRQAGNGDASSSSEPPHRSLGCH